MPAVRCERCHAMAPRRDTWIRGTRTDGTPRFVHSVGKGCRAETPALISPDEMQAITVAMLGEEDGKRVCSGPFGCGERLPVKEFWNNEKTCKKCRKKRQIAVESGAAAPMRIRGARRSAMQLVITDGDPVDDVPRVDYALMSYEGIPIAFEMDRSAVCLTDLWRAAGSPPNMRPDDWLGQSRAKALIAQYARESPIAIRDGNWISRAGQYGGVWRPKEIALAYAYDLSPALHLACNRFVLNNSQQFIETAPSSLDNEALTMIGQLLTKQNQILASLGILPRIDQNTSATAAALAGVELVQTRQTVRCQVYIFRLLPESPFHTLLKEILVTPLCEGESIVGVGRAGPDGDVHEIRIKDYFGKLPFLPHNYELLCVIETDREESETVILHNPIPGGRRLMLLTGKRSRGKMSETFLAATGAAVGVYRNMRAGYYAYETIRDLFVPGKQLRIF